MTSLKIKRCGIVNRHNYIFYNETAQHPYKFNNEMINYYSNYLIYVVFEQ